jgi:predicted MFS family arabinose efflux permease
MVFDASAVTTQRPVAVRDRRRYLVASGVALWGAQVAVVAVPLTAVTELSVDARGTALLAATTAVAFMVLGLPVGAWLDTVRRRPVMITADLLRAATLATLPLADWLDALTFAHLWLVVAVNGIATVFFDLGTQSHLKDLAPADQLVRMNGRLATLTQTALICAPPLAGWAAGILTPTVVLAATSAGYLWSAIWLSRLQTPEPVHPRSPGRHIASDIRDGVAFVWRQPVLLTVLGSGCLVNFGIAAFIAVLPVYVLADLGWTQAQLGLYLGAGGVGGLVGAMTAERVARRLGVGRALLVIGLALCPVAALLPMTGSLVPGPVAALAWSLVLYKVGFDSVLMMSFRQAVTPSHLLGRVNGTMRVLFTAAVALGAGCAGIAAGVIGTTGSIVVAALALGSAWVPVAVSPVSRMVALDGRSEAQPA